MNIPEWLFQESIATDIKNFYNPRPLKQIAQDKIKLDDKQLKKIS